MSTIASAQNWQGAVDPCHSCVEATLTLSFLWDANPLIGLLGIRGHLEGSFCAHIEGLRSIALIFLSIRKASRLNGTLADCRMVWLPSASTDESMFGGKQAYKQSAVGILREYFLSADTAEVATAFTELGKPDMHHIFVKQVCASL